MSTEIQDGFTAKANHVWQLPTQAAMYLSAEENNPMVGAIFAETLMATDLGIVAKNAFVFAHGKHPTRNFFVFFRKNIGDMSFEPKEAHPSQIERQDWMDKDEEDALAELDAKEADPASELEEALLELILGFKS
jgi:hypothetical protein